jgi:hypothetical protein
MVEPLARSADSRHRRAKERELLMVLLLCDCYSKHKSSGAILKEAAPPTTQTAKSRPVR